MMKQWWLFVLFLLGLLVGGCSLKSKATTFEQAMQEGKAWAAWMEQAGVAGVVTVSSSGAPGISIRNDFLFDTSFQVSATIQANSACARSPNNMIDPQ